MSDRERNIHPPEVAALFATSRWHVLGATLCYPQDKYPLAVIGSSRTGKRITYVPVRVVSLSTGHSSYPGVGSRVHAGRAAGVSPVHESSA